MTASAPSRDVAAILQERYHCDVTADVIEYLSAASSRESWSVSSNHPTTLLAEMTHRCPLHCPYCSNPLEMIRADEELTTDDWKRVFTEARELGVLQLGLSGGEPLVRPDVEELAAHARSLGLYTTLVTSGVGLTGSGPRSCARPASSTSRSRFRTRTTPAPIGSPA